jgi:hypothetical protein
VKIIIAPTVKKMKHEARTLSLLRVGIADRSKGGTPILSLALMEIGKI